MSGMTDLTSVASLLVAASQLAAVRAVTVPVKANLLAAGGVEGALGTITMPRRDLPTHNIAVNSRFNDPKRLPAVTQCTPTTIVRTDTVVIHTPIVPPVERIELVESEPRPTCKTSPLVPPWRMPLPSDESHVRLVIKCPPPPPDVMSKGMLLDFFM